MPFVSRFFSTVSLAVLIFVLGVTAFGQSTAFTYQGNLDDGGNPANGNYDFQFVLFDQASGGNQIGTGVTEFGVNVINGSFTVVLDFGAEFPGDPRWLEIGVTQSAPNAGKQVLGTFTVLGPRQPITSVPYAMRSLNSGTSGNSLQLGGVEPSQYVLTTDTRMSDARTPTAGSPDYIQNGTVQQSSSNFNISGTGQATIFDASAQYNFGGSRLITTANTSSLYFGTEAGAANSLNSNNTFIGYRAGKATQGASNNVFVGSYAGENNVGFPQANLGTPGGYNTFVGARAGNANVDGTEATYVGSLSGQFATGSGNTFFGFESGNSASGGNNAFFGRSTGLYDAGSSNAYFGNFTGNSNDTGTFLTLLGHQANVGVNNLVNATAVGAKARVDQSNSLVLGSIAGLNSATENTRVGIGTATPERTLHVKGPGPQEIMVESSDTSGRKWTIQASGDSGNGRFEIVDRTAVASRMAILSDGKVGIGSTAPENRLQVNGAIQVTGGRGSVSGSAVTISSESTFDQIQSWNNRPLAVNSSGNNVGIGNTAPADKLDVTGRIRLSQLGTGGATALCRNASNQISSCSSSIRYKSNVENFASGGDILRSLRPVTFNWRNTGALDVGLVAEEVEKVEPLLVTYNTRGEVEGVKYDRVGVVLVNVLKEQQAELERQNAELDTLRSQLAALKALVCSTNENAPVCGEQEAPPDKW